MQYFASFQTVHIFAIECVGIGMIQSDQRALQANIGRLCLKCKLAQGITAFHLNIAGSNVTTLIGFVNSGFVNSGGNFVNSFLFIHHWGSARQRGFDSLFLAFGLKLAHINNARLYWLHFCWLGLCWDITRRIKQKSVFSQQLARRPNQLYQ